MLIPLIRDYRPEYLLKTTGESTPSQTWKCIRETWACRTAPSSMRPSTRTSARPCPQSSDPTKPHLLYPLCYIKQSPFWMEYSILNQSLLYLVDVACYFINKYFGLVFMAASSIGSKHHLLLFIYLMLYEFELRGAIFNRYVIIIYSN